jgi:hypothetical protein
VDIASIQRGRALRPSPPFALRLPLSRRRAPGAASPGPWGCWTARWMDQACNQQRDMFLWTYKALGGGRGETPAILRHWKATPLLIHAPGDG